AIPQQGNGDEKNPERCFFFALLASLRAKEVARKDAKSAKMRRKHRASHLLTINATVPRSRALTCLIAGFSEPSRFALPARSQRFATTLPPFFRPAYQLQPASRTSRFFAIPPPSPREDPSLKRIVLLLLTFSFFLLSSAMACAVDEPAKPGEAAKPEEKPEGPKVPKLDNGDTAWMLMSTGLVLFMVPGLALFYGGMVRRKNVLGTMMQSMIALGLIGIQWVLIGYCLAFGDSQGGFIGWSRKLIGLEGVN